MQAYSASATAAAAAVPSAGTKSREEAGVAKERESSRVSKTFRIVSPVIETPTMQSSPQRGLRSTGFWGGGEQKRDLRD